MKEIEVTVDGFTGRITNDLFIMGKKGDKLTVTDEAWEVISTKHKKWFKFLRDVKEDKLFESPKNKMVEYKEFKRSRTK